MTGRNLMRALDAELVRYVGGQEADSPRESGDATRDRALRVLIVEDWPQDAELMVGALRAAGYAPTWTRVDTEADYLAALEDAPDLVLCDHSLPQFNSTRALELLRSRRRHIPFIVVSGSVDEEQAVDGMRLGADDCVLKGRLARLGPAVAGALERKRLQREKDDAEQRLTLTMSWLEALLQNSQALIFIKNIDGRYVHVNREFERRMKITSAQILNRTDEEVFPAEQAARFRANDRRVLAAGKPIRIEESARHEDGSHLYVVAKFPLRAADGSFFGIAGIATDITERQLAERRILRLNRLYRTLSGTNAIIVRARDRATLFRDVCKIAVENGGFTKAWYGLLDPATGRLQAATHDGSAARYMIDFQSAIDNNVRDGLDPAATAMREGRLSVCNDLLSDPNFAPWHGLAREHGFRSLAALPLISGGRVIGVLALKADAVDFFDEELIALLREMADDISFALEKLELEERHRQAVRALEESDEKFRQLAGNIPQVFWLTDVEQKNLVYVSPAFECVTGRRLADLGTDPRNLLQAVHPDDRERVRHAGRHRAPLGTYDIEYRVLHVDGQLRWIRDRAFPVRDAAGVIYRIAGIADDITERKRSEERLLQLAHYDHLTGLPNRTLFQDRLGQVLARAHRHGSIFAVLFLDLDRFKVVNDTLSHASGDRLLQQVGERLGRRLRPGDTVGRISGDEFAVILADLAQPEHAGRVAQTLRAAFAAPFDLDGHEVFVTASVGITVYPTDAIDAEALLKNADTAMHNAKAQGRNTYRYYTPAMLEGALSKMQLEMKLRRALEREEFVLHYQPKIDIASGEMVGVEALLR